jgi:pimeloyl-ACP methyl ester carboxylesterase
MLRHLRRLFVLTCLSSLALVLAAAAPAGAVCDPDGLQSSGAVYRICMPAPGQWNGRLVIWAHGYVAFFEPVVIPENQLRLPDGTYLPDLVNSLGYAFATTSYSVNGLAVRQGLADVIDLVSIFTDLKGPARRVYLVGASEGGLITTLGVEQRPDVFSGGLATCGPIGSWPRQINYVGDGRVVFDYFYPGLIPAEVTQIPPELIASWPTHYATRIRPVIFAPANLSKTREYMRVAKLPADPLNFWPTAERSILDVLTFNIVGTNDATEKIGGQPFDNVRRIYFGSSNDLLLNFSVERIAADPAALTEMRAHYDTTGVLRRPLVTLHTLLDQQVPYWHELLYTGKVVASGSVGQFASLPVNRYGHCNFTPAEVLTAFGLLVLKTEGLSLTNVAGALKSSESVAEFDRLAAKHGLLARPR